MIQKHIELIIAIMALIVSIASCNFSNSKADMALETAKSANSISSRHNYLSLEPAIYFDLKHVPAEKTIEFSVHNAGSGPAVIYNFEIYFKRDPLMPFPTHPKSILKKLELDDYNFTTREVGKGMILKSGDSVRILELPKQFYTNEVYNNFKKGFVDVGVVACYCSMYEDECYYSRDGVLDGIKRSCSVNGVDKVSAWKRGKLMP